MYTNNVYAVEEDSNKYNDYNDYNDYSAYEDNINYQESSSRSSSGLVVKIIIIVLCILVLICLILALKKGSNSGNNSNIHAENVQKVRLGSEKYFFLQNNMPSGNEVKTVTLNTLINKGLVSEVVDANKKVCDGTQTFVTLNEDGNYYVLKVNLSCSTNDKQEVFRYSKSTYACIDCNGKTNMTGDNKPQDNQETKTSDSIAKTSTYSCTTWSEWSDTRVIDSSLEERTRVVVLGVKKGGTKVVTSTSVVTKSVLIPTSATTSATCSNGYVVDDGKCLSTTRTRGDLTYSQYSSGNYKIYNMPCDSIDTEYRDGKYVLVYKGCEYSKYQTKSSSDSSSGGSGKKGNNNSGSNGSNNNNNNQTVITEPDEYTTDYYEEKDLPAGFVKSVGSEKTQYSYKLKKCEK